MRPIFHGVASLGDIVGFRSRWLTAYGYFTDFCFFFFKAWDSIPGASDLIKYMIKICKIRDSFYSDIAG